MKTTILKQVAACVLLLFNTILSAQNPGDIDTSFNIGTGFNELITTIVQQPDETILVGGWFTEYNGTSQNYITRLNPDGSIDTSFNIGTGFDWVVDAIALQSDGKILVGGGFNVYNGTSQNKIIRLNSDGSIDISFNIGTGFNATVEEIILQADGKVLVGGWFTEYNGTTQNRIVRLNPDGSLDTSFDIGTGFNSTFVGEITLQSDGKILAGGNFTAYNGQPRNDLARLNPDGSLDTSFDIGTGFDSAISYVYNITLQPEGKILVGGMFTSYNGTTQNNITRLYSNGILDTSFNTGTGFSNYVEAIALQADGKILVGGQFTEYNGTTRNNIASLNTDGSLDTVFNVGAGFNATVQEIILQADGKVLVGGWFTEYNGTAQNRLVRLHNYEQCPPQGDIWLMSQEDVDNFGINYPNCTTINGNLYIGTPNGPSDITDLSPLSNLVIVNGGIYIWYNPILTTLSGLDNLLYVHTITILNNSQLTDISALQGMDLANLAGLTIVDNPLLEFCHLLNICTYLQGSNPRDINGNSGNCIDEPAVLNACSLSVEGNAFSKITVYPNPTDNQVNISSSQTIQAIEVYDVTGKLLQLYEQSGNDITLDVSSLPTGLYITKIKTDEGWFSQKLIKK